MEINQEQIIEELEKQPTGVDKFLSDRRLEKNREEFESKRPFLFAWANVLAVLLIVSVYFLSSFSKINTLSVTGVNYLTPKYVEQLSGINYNSRFFLISPNRTSKRIEENPFIESCRIVALNDNAIQIDITENQPFGYHYAGEQAEIWFTNDEVMPLSSDLMSVISRVPYINGFDEEQQHHLLSKALSTIDPKMIEEMSQISQYAFQYDDEAILIEMRDGTNIITSFYTMDLVNRYQEIFNKMENKDYCIFASEGKNIAYAKTCPWNEPEVVYEYWTDEEGNIIKNKWGDPAVKHYYKDRSGLYYLDSNGNYILIPIDAGGNDVRDPDFLNHYFSGYYATGELVIPEEELEEESQDSENQDGENTEQTETNTEEG